MLALFALVLGLLGAAPISLLPPPSVVVYPLLPNDSTVDRETASRLATTIAARIGDSGDVKVLPPKPGAERKDYLAEAQREGADYYLSGYVSGLGTGVTAVIQLVSVQSGIVVYSLSNQMQTLREAEGPADTLRAAILRHAGRNLAGYSAPSAPPPATPTPAPSPSEGNLGGIFRRRRPAAATPSPSPTPSAAVSASPAAAS